MNNSCRRLPRLIKPFIIFFTVSLLLSGSPAQAQAVPGIGGSVPTLAPMLEKVTPAVVNISVVSQAPRGVGNSVSRSGTLIPARQFRAWP